MSEMDFEDSPIFMIRLVAETGCIMNGGAAHVGSVGATVLRCSWTSWRALRKSVPRLNRRGMCDSCGTDSERTTSTPGTPFSASSSGTVTSSSTSEADRPRQAVWSSTRVGANSGKTSTFSFLSSWKPKKMRAAAAATTRKRNLRLVATIQRMVPAAALVLLDPVLDAQQLLGADGHHRSSCGRPLPHDRDASLGAQHVDRRAHVGQPPRTRVRERMALGVVDHGRVRDHRAMTAVARGDGADQCGPDADAPGGLRGEDDARQVAALHRLKAGGTGVAGGFVVELCRLPAAGDRKPGRDQRHSHTSVPVEHLASPSLPQPSGCRSKSGSAAASRSARGARAAFGDVTSRRYSAGRTSRVSAVDVTSPPRTTTAVEWVISLPATSPRTANGRSAAAVTGAVSAPAGAGSAAPRVTSAASPPATPSPRRSSRCLTSMTVLRTAIPST